MSKVHLLAGPNNAGKSNVLMVAKRILPDLRTNSAYEPDALDVPVSARGADESPFKIAILKTVTGEELAAAVDNQAWRPELLLALFSGPAFDRDDDHRVWFEFEWDPQSPGWKASQAQIDDLGAAASQHDVRLGQLSSHLTGTQGGNADAARVLTNLIKRLKVASDIPEIASIGPFRRITPGATADVVEDEHNGPGLIERLAELQNPDYDGDELQERFDRINHFLQTLLDDDEARIEIPYKRDTILVYHGGHRLPLDNYGTGLHEVIVLAAAATVLSDHLVCIEEPEIHLHPTLQRNLLNYLRDSTDNRYLVATHSAHMLDFANASISAVRLVDGHTELSRAIEPAEVAAISFDLGARASDVVQANAVIWVEGPSDRIYIRAWMAELAPELIEGIHFSILHYGGRLLSHLSANDAAVTEFVRLPRINRNFAVVIDSDRTSAHQQLGQTKQRIRREIDAIPGCVTWITKGYTIENYVPRDLLVEAVAAVHPHAHLWWSGNRFQNPFAPGKIRGTPKQVDKIAIAQHVADRWDATVWPLDLKQKAKALVEMVLAANA